MCTLEGKSFFLSRTHTCEYVEYRRGRNTAVLERLRGVEDARSYHVVNNEEDGRTTRNAAAAAAAFVGSIAACTRRIPNQFFRLLLVCFRFF